MKKIIILAFVLCCVFCMSINAQNVPTYKQICDIKGVKDCKVYNEGTDNAFYYFTFTQPLGKNFFTQQADTSTFTTRVLAVIKDVEKPTLFFVSGYELSLNPDTLYKHPDYYKLYCPDIVSSYEANFVYMEHRFFGPDLKDDKTGYILTTPGLTSYPDNFITKLDYLTTENAATDFHNIISALKKNILKGKTVMAGWSKGGMTTTLQSYYYPEDVDVFIPYSAPFCNGCEDPRMYAWINDSIQPGSSEIRAREKQFMNFMMKKDTTDNYVYKEYHRLKTKRFKNNKSYNCYTDLQLDTLTQTYYELSLYCNVRWDLWAYQNRDVINTLINIDSLHTSTNTSEILLYCIWNGNARDTQVVDGWKNNILNSPEMMRAKRRNPLTELEWNQFGYFGNHTAYQYQSTLELGDYLMSLKEDYPESMYANTGPSYSASDSIQNALKTHYTHSTYEKMFESVRNTESKILFIYGGDDPWTGGRIEDKYLGASNVKRFILPSQNHRASILDAPESLRESIFSEVLDPWIFGYDPSGIKDISQSTANRQRSTEMYNLNGVRVNSDYKGIVISNGRKYLLR